MHEYEYWNIVIGNVVSKLSVSAAELVSFQAGCLIEGKMWTRSVSLTPVWCWFEDDAQAIQEMWSQIRKKPKHIRSCCMRRKNNNKKLVNALALLSTTRPHTLNKWKTKCVWIFKADGGCVHWRVEWVCFLYIYWNKIGNKSIAYIDGMCWHDKCIETVRSGTPNVGRMNHFRMGRFIRVAECIHTCDDVCLLIVLHAVQLHHPLTFLVFGFHWTRYAVIHFNWSMPHLWLPRMNSAALWNVFTFVSFIAFFFVCFFHYSLKKWNERRCRATLIWYATKFRVRVECKKFIPIHGMTHLAVICLVFVCLISIPF